MSLFKKLHIFFPAFIALFLLVPTVSAATPDGGGPWADSVLSSSQGMMKNGLPVPAIRSNPSSALGVAEDNTVNGNFFSLGFGGNIALGFVNGISSGVIIVEATNPDYPSEKAKIEVSENGTTWVNAGTITQDGSVNKPAAVGCAKYVRITDISDPAIMPDDIADGYDVDGVKATGQPCSPPPTCEIKDGCCTTTINQSNKAVIVNNTTIVQTGTNTTANVTNTTTANSNVAKAGACCGSNSKANMNKKGAGSKVKMNVNAASKKIKK